MTSGASSRNAYCTPSLKVLIEYNRQFDYYDVSPEDWDDWIDDRSQFLVWKNVSFAENRRVVIQASAPDERYTDLGHNIVVDVRDINSSTAIPDVVTNYVFGSSTSDAVIGGSRDDRLYGGRGADFLEGKSGAGQDRTG